MTGLPVKTRLASIKIPLKTEEKVLWVCPTRKTPNIRRKQKKIPKNPKRKKTKPCEVMERKQRIHYIKAYLGSFCYPLLVAIPLSPIVDLIENTYSKIGSS